MPQDSLREESLLRGRAILRSWVPSGRVQLACVKNEQTERLAPFDLLGRTTMIKIVISNNRTTYFVARRLHRIAASRQKAY